MHALSRFVLALSIVSVSAPLGALSFVYHHDAHDAFSVSAADELKRVDIPGFEIGKTSETSQETFGKKIDGDTFEEKSTYVFL